MKEEFDEIAKIMFSCIEKKYSKNQIVNEYVKKFSIIYVYNGKTLLANLNFSDADVKLYDNLVTKSYLQTINEKIFAFEQNVLEQAFEYIYGTIEGFITDYNDNFDNKLIFENEELSDVIISSIIDNKLMSTARTSLFKLFDVLQEEKYLLYRKNILK